MALREHKTKLVCTIGPASDSPQVMREMIRAGMSVARLNFSHGDFEWHEQVILNLREAARAEGRRITIMGDLPGPKMRIGLVEGDSIMLSAGESISLTSDDILGTTERISVSIPNLSSAVKPGDYLFLNDGHIELEVVTVSGGDTHCKILVGGELRSRKGLNLPGTDLGISAFTERDHECLKFAMNHGVDAVSQSFVESADDLHAVRKAAADIGATPFIIAKIERASALDNIDEIIRASDGVMIARGDLGVETRLERMAVLQKQLIKKVNTHAKPVITATQMLESMAQSARPTRAEATDVANAILDGTDCVMLSEESAMGRSPVAAVRMLGRIAAATEPHRALTSYDVSLAEYDRDGDIKLGDLISRSVNQVAALVHPGAVFAPTASGHAARLISRFRLPVWILAASEIESTCQNLQFSYGIAPFHVEKYPDDWAPLITKWVEQEGLAKELVVLTQGPSRRHPDANPRIEIIDLRRADRAAQQLNRRSTDRESPGAV